MTKSSQPWRLDLGANIQPDGSVSFKVWAPRCGKVDLRLLKGDHDDVVPMNAVAEGYFTAKVKGSKAGDRYFFVLNNEKERPDPASRFQPLGVHGPSEVVDANQFKWTDGKWKGVGLADFILYEMHVGTFTPEGTFEAAIEKLDYLKKLGITCVEVMPIAQFPGARNWGYDGVGLFAPQNSYGGPDGFKKFVNACHARGLAVCLDVVYNHLGPEGNYLRDFAPYFTGKYHTPWGDAVNFDDMGSHQVRKWMIANGLYWITEYHVDALRFDAIHAIYDSSAVHFLAQFNDKINREAKKLKRTVVTIAESDLNDAKVVKSQSSGGYGFDAQWADDFHHAVHVKLTGERQSYYQDYSGLRDVTRSLSAPFLYQGEYSEFRQRRYGGPVKGIRSDRFVSCTQNHDQVGNRALGDRLSATVSFRLQKLVAALQLMAPYTPLLWMGQEYGEEAPFQYFIDHSDEDLIRAVREGRKREFISVKPDLIPDPSAEETFQHSKLRWKCLQEKKHQQLLTLYTDLIALRKKLGLSGVSLSGIKTQCEESREWLSLEYRTRSKKTLAVLFLFGGSELTVPWPFGKRRGKGLLYTEEKKYGGTDEIVASCSAKQPPLMQPESVWIGSLGT